MPEQLGHGLLIAFGILECRGTGDVDLAHVDALFIEEFPVVEGRAEKHR